MPATVGYAAGYTHGYRTAVSKTFGDVGTASGGLTVAVAVRLGDAGRGAGGLTFAAAGSATTMRAYNALPAIYRAADAGYGLPLLRYLALMIDPLDTVFTLLERIDFTGPSEYGGDAGDTSDLVDPETADDSWLAWLGQHLGLPVAGRTAAQLRPAIIAAEGGGPVATRAAIIAAVQPILSGSKFVDVLPGRVSTAVAGGRWDLLVQTRATETTGAPASVLNAVLQAEAKPAGVRLHYDVFASSWAAIMAANPTLATLSGQTWQQIMSTP